MTPFSSRNKPASINIIVKEKTLLIELPGKQPILSWTPFNGGVTQSSCIFNHQNDDFEEKELASIFESVTQRLQLPKDSVGLITGANINRYQEAFVKSGPIWVHGVATVGLNNARAAGDEADVPLGKRANHSGTINLILACNALPEISGQMEAIQIAAMAKAAAMIENGVQSKKSDRLATGTGTDCIVITSSGEIQENYCGMHTVIGELIGKVVRNLIEQGIKTWPG